MRHVVAIVGRPNVGKSTLFNRLVGFHKAIVEDMPGVTRDLNYADVDRFERPFTLIDTGGFEPVARKGIMAQVAEQCRLAVEEADVIVFLLDGKDGLTPSDYEITRLLRHQDKRVLFAVNKIDSHLHEERVYDFYRLGEDILYPISAQHNRGVERLSEAIIEQLRPLPPQDTREGGALRIAVVGRPNVGKSSLINCILGYERVIVHDAPGTTRDAVDTSFSVGKREYIIVDTAGIRRKGRISLKLEKYCVVEAIKGIERSDVVLLILDAYEGPTEQDARIGGLIHDKGRGGVLVVNKWDLINTRVTATSYSETVREHLQFLSYTPLIFVSAVTGVGVPRMLEVVNEVAAEQSKRIPTPKLNRWLQDVTALHHPPRCHTKSVTFSYITQVSTHPPTFIIFTNRPTGIRAPYKRYLNNQLREKFGFAGNPIRLVFRKK